MLVGVIAQHATRRERVARRHAHLQRQVARLYALAEHWRNQAVAEEFWSPRQSCEQRAQRYQREAADLSAIIRVEMGIE